ncbi:hypothetical protein ACFE04_013772 [Oxalis oulophora]
MTIGEVRKSTENTKSTEDLPNEFGELLEKKFVFGIEIQKGNIKKIHRAYTVKYISEDENIFKEFNNSSDIQTSQENSVQFIESINSSPNNNKGRNKRAMEESTEIILIDDESPQSSSSKAPKLMKVKIESKE